MMPPATDVAPTQERRGDFPAPPSAQVSAPEPPPTPPEPYFFSGILVDRTSLTPTAGTCAVAAPPHDTPITCPVEEPALAARLLMAPEEQHVLFFGHLRSTGSANVLVQAYFPLFWNGTHWQLVPPQAPQEADHA